MTTQLITTQYVKISLKLDKGTAYYRMHIHAGDTICTELCSNIFKLLTKIKVATFSQRDPRKGIECVYSR
jgi:hypothetical protein